jgi:hypothetical protein
VPREGPLLYFGPPPACRCRGALHALYAFVANGEEKRGASLPPGPPCPLASCHPHTPGVPCPAREEGGTIATGRGGLQASFAGFGGGFGRRRLPNPPV